MAKFTTHPRHTVRDAAEMLRLSEQMVRYLARKMGIEKTGRDWLFTGDELKQMVHRKTKPGPEKKAKK